MDDDIKLVISRRELVGSVLIACIILGATVCGYVIGRFDRKKTQESAIEDYRTPLEYPEIDQEDPVQIPASTQPITWLHADHETRAGEFDTSDTNMSSTDGYVASRTGEKYYPADCSAADRIKPENMITFSTADEAERAGYSASTQCE